MNELATQIRDKLRKQFSKSTIGFAGEAVSTRSTLRGVIVTRIDPLNNYLFSDIGGIPLGRMGEIYAEEGRGKTSVGLEIIAAAQRAGGVGIYVETEGTFERQRAIALDVDIDSLILCEPSCIEEALEQIQAAMDGVESTHDHPVVVVWDSLAATPTAKEIEDGLQEKKAVMTERGRVMARAVRVMSMMAAETGVAIVIINQAREKIGISFGDSTTTPSSGVLKFHCAWRLHIRGGAVVKSGDATVGIDVIFFSKKNKLSPDKRKFTARLLHASGWARSWTTINYAKDVGVVPANMVVTNKNAKAARTALHWPGGEAESIIPAFVAPPPPKKVPKYVVKKKAGKEKPAAETTETEET